MLEIDGFSKESVYKLMFHHLYILNFWSFKLEDLIRVKHPKILESDEYMHIIEEYGLREAKGLAKILGTSGHGIDSLIQLLQCSHWAIFEHMEVEKLTKESCRMRIIKCSTQRAAKNWEMEHYECADITFLCLRGFCDHVNRNINIQQVFAPPDKIRPKGTPENVSCEWVFSIQT